MQYLSNKILMHVAQVYNVVCHTYLHIAITELVLSICVCQARRRGEVSGAVPTAPKRVLRGAGSASRASRASAAGSTGAAGSAGAACGTGATGGASAAGCLVPGAGLRAAARRLSGAPVRALSESGMFVRDLLHRISQAVWRALGGGWCSLGWFSHGLDGSILTTV